MGGLNQELDSHCIRPISSQGGWETYVVGFIASDGNVRHAQPPQSGHSFLRSFDDQVTLVGPVGPSPATGYLRWREGSPKSRRSRTLDPGERGGGGRESGPPIVPDRQMTGWSSQMRPCSQGSIATIRCGDFRSTGARLTPLSMVL